MTVAVPSIEPSEIRAGDTAQWNKEVSDYPASDGWALSYILINKDNKYTISTTGSGSTFSATISAATTATYVAGTYNWYARVSKSGEVKTIDEGIIEVKPDISVLNTVDGRSHAKKVLDNINAVIENRATKDQEEYTIGNRSLKRTPLEDLIKLRDKYQAMYNAELAAENINAGLGNKKRILVRFPGK